MSRRTEWGRWPGPGALFKRCAPAGQGVPPARCSRVRLLLVGALLLAATPGPGVSQAPDEAWRTLETEHFRVTFPAHLESLGRKAAERAERAWSALETHFIEPPDGIVDILVTDHTDVSNGFAAVTPSNRVTIHARPPVDALSLGHLDEWFELVITHELAHIVHLDHVVNPVGRLARTVFGRIPGEWPTFPELGTPRWLIEGLATWYESRLTNAGRVKGTFLDMQLRTAMLEGRFEHIDQASGESPLWPGGNRPYAYGALFFEHLLERYGEDRMAAFADAIGAQWVPYRIDSAGEDAFGVPLSDAWRAWRDSLQAELADLDADLRKLGPISEPERLTEGARWALHPTPSPDGALLAYTRSDGRSDMQIRVRDVRTGASRSVGRTNGLATFSWLSDTELLVSQLEFDDPYSTYGDLYVFGIDGTRRRLTEGARLTQPWAGPAGSTAVAVQEGGGTNALVRLHLDAARRRVTAVDTIVAAEPDVHWAFPSVSPDGRRIAASRWEPNALHDVVIVDAASGELVARVTRDRAIDMAPRWSPDGRWLVWGSDRTGILNVHGVRMDKAGDVASEVYMLSNVRTGAAYPSVDPSGSWIFVSGHHVDGWEVERLPFPSASALPTPALDARFALDGPAPERGLAGGPVGSYSAWPTLRPRFWELSYREPIDAAGLVADGFFLRRRELLGAGVGFETSGRDLVGRHGYGAAVRVSTSGGEVDGFVSYSYAGLGNPILSLTARQSFADGGQQLAGSDADTLFVLERERTLSGAATFLAPTWRRNLSVTLSSGMVWERRELLDVALEPSRDFALARPTSRLWDVTASVNVNTTRSHSFQMGTAAGLSLFALGRVRRELSLPDSLDGRPGADRATQETLGRLQGAVSLWDGSYARHVLGFQATGGVAGGPGAGPFHYRVGGASGRPEPLTGLELFGGGFLFFPVRGYDVSARFGRYAWTASVEYRIPLWLVNEGLGAWPIHVDRTLASIFFDTGNAWGPDVTATGFRNTARDPLASIGAELTAELLGFFDIRTRLRVGVALPLVEPDPVVGLDGPNAYVRVGLAY